MSQGHRSMDRSLRRHLLAGLAGLALLGGGMGGWAATSQLAGAVVALGSVVVDSHVKKVQHPTGGVVGEIRVRDGDQVNAGDLVVRLDETVTRANLAVVTNVIPYVMALSALLVMMRTANVSGGKFAFTAAVAFLGMAYSVYAIALSGKDAVFGGTMVMCVAFIIWAWISPRFMRAGRVAPALPKPVRTGTL